MKDSQLLITRTMYMYSHLLMGNLLMLLKLEEKLTLLPRTSTDLFLLRSELMVYFLL